MVRLRNVAAPRGAPTESRGGAFAPMDGIDGVSMNIINDDFWERCDAIEAELASTLTQVEEVNHRNKHLKEESCAAREGFMHQVGEAETELTRTRGVHAAEVKRVLDEAASSKGACDRGSEWSDVVEAELASTHTQVEEANRRNKHLGEENCAAREGLMRKVEEANCRNKHLKEENCAAREGLMRKVEEANRRNERLEEENYAAREGLMRKVEEANRCSEHIEEEVCSLEDAKAEATKLDVKVEHLSDEVPAAHAKCKEKE